MRLSFRIFDARSRSTLEPRQRRLWFACRDPKGKCPEWPRAAKGRQACVQGIEGVDQDEAVLEELQRRGDHFLLFSAIRGQRSHGVSSDSTQSNANLDGVEDQPRGPSHRSDHQRQAERKVYDFGHAQVFEDPDDGERRAE
jgi:hypothetical protein